MTGRGNNTLKDKNLLEILAHPVLLYLAYAVRKVKGISLYYFSSDNEEILDAAGAEDYKRIVRIDFLGSPTAQLIDVI